MPRIAELDSSFGDIAISISSARRRTASSNNSQVQCQRFINIWQNGFTCLYCLSAYLRIEKATWNFIGLTDRNEGRRRDSLKTSTISITTWHNDNGTHDIYYAYYIDRSLKIMMREYLNFSSRILINMIDEEIHVRVTLLSHTSTFESEWNTFIFIDIIFIRWHNSWAIHWTCKKAWSS